MSNGLIFLAENLPQTGDDFHAGKFIIIGAAAIAVAAVSFLIARKKDDDDE